MRLQVAAREIEEKKPVLVVIDGVLEQGQALFKHIGRLTAELVVVKDAVGARLVILLEARGVEQA